MKLENILLSEDGLNEMKLVGFYEGTIYDENIRLMEIAGTIAYTAPEVLQMAYGSKCDIWSCGVIAYTVISGKQPFKGANDEETYENIMNARCLFSDVVWGSISDIAKDFITKLLTWDENLRPTAEEALQHMWFTGENTDFKNKTSQKSKKLKISKSKKLSNRANNLSLGAMLESSQKSSCLESTGKLQDDLLSCIQEECSVKDDLTWHSTHASNAKEKKLPRTPLSASQKISGNVLKKVACSSLQTSDTMKIMEDPLSVFEQKPKLSAIETFDDAFERLVQLNEKIQVFRGIIDSRRW